MSLPPVTVALTTIRARLPQLPLVVGSLLRQTRAPDQILLSISAEPFMLDEGVRFADLPAALRDLAAAGRLDVLAVPNTGPYRKLLPALRQHAGSPRLVATADDDMLYAPTWLAGLLERFEAGPAVCAYRCRAMATLGGRFARYARWPLLPAGPDAHGDAPPHLHPLLTIATGVRGVLYDAAFFPDLDLLDALRALAPGQDDLAFKAASLCGGIPTALVHRPGADAGRPKGVLPGDTLFESNKRANDGAWNRIVGYLEAIGRFRLSDLLGT